MTPTRYPIGAVAKLTGLGLDTIRAWERRYGAVAPGRDERGRLYSERDVARLQLLRDVVGAGHAIGRVADLSDAALRNLLDRTSALAQPADRAQPGHDRTALSAAVERFDTAAVDAELVWFSAFLRPRELVRDVLMPALNDVGDAWHRGEARVAHEHLISATIRTVLGTFLRMYPRRAGAPRLIFSTPAGERHEIGTLGAAMIAASAGIDAVYLGPDLPAADIAEAAAIAGAAAVVLGLTVLPRGTKVHTELRTLARALGPGCELWLGGRGAAKIDLHARPGVFIGDYAALEQHLVRIDARR